MFTDQLDVQIAEKSLLGHSFYRRWMAGNLRVQDLKVYAAQYYCFEEAFPRFLSAIHSNCLDSELRGVVLENLWDEEHGSKNHVQLWVNFCKGIGISVQELQATKPLSGTTMLLETYRRLCSGPVGLGAVYAYESQAPGIMSEKLAGLKQWFPSFESGTLEFFQVHQELDKKHAQAERDVLETKVLDGPSVQCAVQEALDAWWGFLDGVEAALP